MENPQMAKKYKDERDKMRDSLDKMRESEVIARAHRDGFRVMKRGHRKGVDQYWLMFGEAGTIDMVDNTLNRLEDLIGRERT
jgi:hypothetical protein